MLQMGFATLVPQDCPFLWLGGILHLAIAICYHSSLVVDRCSDHQIKMAVCHYSRKLFLNCFISHAAPCHMSWWVHFAVCCFYLDLERFVACLFILCSMLSFGYTHHLFAASSHGQPSFILHYNTVHRMLEPSASSTWFDVPPSQEALGITFFFPYSERKWYRTWIIYLVGIWTTG